MTDLTNPIFSNEDAARTYLEQQRWPDGPYCPHCGEVEKITRMSGVSHRPGLFQCNSCRKTFTVTVGTLYERSKVPLHKWMLATHFLCASKKGMSAHQLHRMLGVTYKTAWFMAHRIREAMLDPTPPPLGGKGQTVEANDISHRLVAFLKDTGLMERITANIEKIAESTDESPGKPSSK